jgi:hypothetical protein
MIVKGKSRSGAAQLSEYLLRDEPGQTVSIVETAFGHEGDERAQRQAVFDSLMHFEEMAAFTEGEKGLYHAKLNPDALASQQMEDHHWSQAADIVAAKLGKQHQPRVIVLHEKEDGRVHGHVVFMRTEQSGHGFRLIPDGHNYAKHERAAREIEAVQIEIDHQPVRGQFTGRDRDAETGHFTEPRPGYDLSTESYQPKSYGQRDARQAKKAQMSPEARKAEITSLWEQSGSGQAFVSAAHEAGYDLAQGDRKPIHILVRDGEAYDLRRSLGVKKKEILERLEEYPAAQLPTVAEVRTRQLAQMRERQQREDQERAQGRGHRKAEPTLTGQFDKVRDPGREEGADTAVIAKDDDAGIAHEDTPEPEIFDRDAYQMWWEKSIQQAGIEAALEREIAEPLQMREARLAALEITARAEQDAERSLLEEFEAQRDAEGQETAQTRQRAARVAMIEAAMTEEREELEGAHIMQRNDLERSQRAARAGLEKNLAGDWAGGEYRRGQRFRTGWRAWLDKYTGRHDETVRQNAIEKEEQRRNHEAQRKALLDAFREAKGKMERRHRQERAEMEAYHALLEGEQREIMSFGITRRERLAQERGRETGHAQDYGHTPGRGGDTGRTRVFAPAPDF